MVPHTLPRFVRAKRLANGGMGFYWELTGYYRKVRGAPSTGSRWVMIMWLLVALMGTAVARLRLNALFDEWRAIRAGQPVCWSREIWNNRLAIPRIQANESLSRKGFETVAP